MTFGTLAKLQQVFSTNSNVRWAHNEDLLLRWVCLKIGDTFFLFLRGEP